VNHQNTHPFFLVFFLFLSLSHAVFSETQPLARALLAGKEWTLRLARTPEERSRGLMEVKSLSENEGMVFLYSSDERRTFWMKDVYVGLDILFLDKNFTVLEIVHQAPPEFLAVSQKDGTVVYHPSEGGPFIVSSRSEQVRHVLEIAAGMAKRLGINPGQKLRWRFPGLSGINID
jgi:hypothetical protein